MDFHASMDEMAGDQGMTRAEFEVYVDKIFDEVAQQRTPREAVNFREQPPVPQKPGFIRTAFNSVISKLRL